MEPSTDTSARLGPRERLPRAVRLQALTLVGLVAAVFLVGFPVLDRIEYHVYDLVHRMRPPSRPSERLILVEADEESLAALGRWPWPRRVFARTIENLGDDGAAVVAFTMAFVEPDTQEPRRFLDRSLELLAAHQVEDPELHRQLEALREEADNDAALARAITSSPAPVVLGFFFHLDPRSPGTPRDPAEIARLDQRIQAAALPALRLPAGLDPPRFPEAVAPAAPIAPLAAATPHLGFLQLSTDPDGSVRRAPLLMANEGRLYPSLALQVAWNALGRPPREVVVTDLGPEGLSLGPERFVATDELGRILVNFSVPPGGFPRISLARVARGDFPPGTFRDRVVLVGSTAQGIASSMRTPVAAYHPGLEIHASVVDNLLRGTSLVRPGWYVGLDLAAILLLGGVACLALGRLGALTETVLALGHLVGYVAFQVWLFHRHGVALTLVFPLMALVVAWGWITLERYLMERRQRRQVEGAFGRYVAPRVMDQMLRQPEQLRLGGEERVITVLFSDLKGFTSCSEALGPARMVDLMCEYFEEMTAQIYHQDGLLKEYVGDEIMALFGAPLEQPDHAARACRAAMAMRDRLAELAAQWQARGLPPLSARWGVNSGEMLVGNLGSSYRFSYGALGDNVNLGSRLEGLNGQYGTEIMIGENTEALVRDQFHLRELDSVRVKGKARGVRVFQLLGEADQPLEASLEALLPAYARALKAYRSQRFEDARRHFQAVQEIDPGDGPTRVMLERCELYLASPPGEDWDGVFTATKK